jgi:hypothetical protein
MGMGEVKRGGKLNLAFDLKVITSEQGELIATIAKIRNHFAHGAGNLGNTLLAFLRAQKEVSDRLQKAIHRLVYPTGDGPDLTNFHSIPKVYTMVAALTCLTLIQYHADHSEQARLHRWGEGLLGALGSNNPLLPTSAGGAP